jgi:hypothetical protein
VPFGSVTRRARGPQVKCSEQSTWVMSRSGKPRKPKARLLGAMPTVAPTGAVMTMISDKNGSTVEPFPGRQATTVIDELNRIFTLLRDATPRDATISFDFDGQLHVHIDVRRREEVTLLEALLPSLGGGLFHSMTRGSTPHHPFFHRMSAVVAS